MSILITTKTRTTAGPVVVMHCPYCGTTSVEASTVDRVEQLGLFYVLPLLRVRSTLLQCTACGRQSLTKVPIEQITSYSPDEITQSIIRSGSFISYALSVIALLLCWCPVVGLVMGIIAIAANLRARGWASTMAWVATGLSVLITLLFFALLKFA